MKWRYEDISNELESLRQTLPPKESTAMLRRLAADWQRLADLIILISREGDAAAIDPKSRLGQRLAAQKQEPRSALEMFRFIYSYYSNG